MKKPTKKVERILNMSLRQAKLYDDTEVKIEHILISLINDYNNNAIKILLNLGVDVDTYNEVIETKCTYWESLYIVTVFLDQRYDKMYKAREIFNHRMKHGNY